MSIISKAPLADGVSVCLFGAYGTLFDVNAALSRHVGDLGDKTGPLTSLWRNRQSEQARKANQMAEYEDFWYFIGRGLDEVMAELNLDNPVLRAKLLDCFLCPELYPDVKEVLTALSERNVKTAILSNGSPFMLTSAVTNTGIQDLLKELISVDPARHYLPHPSVYQLAVDELNSQAGRICFLSADSGDVAAASDFGLQAVWINRLGRQWELPSAPLVHEISTLAELSALLPA